ncbi:MAG TPA: O-antigen ligase family protein [Clostridia bacterium]|nr:O-antigen ligase family protein [Clostridia bacterium]
MKSTTEALKTFAAPLLLFTFVGIAGAIVLQRSLLLALAAIVLAGVVGLMLRQPEWGTALILFAIYSNVAVAVMRFVATGGAPVYVGGLDNGGMANVDAGMRAALLASVGLALVVPVYQYVWVRRQQLVFDRTLALIWFFLCSLMLSAVFCRDPMLSLWKIFRFVSEGLILYFLVINVVRDGQTLRRAMWTLVIAASLMGGLSVFQEASGTQDNTYWGMAQRGGVFVTNSSGDQVVTRTRAAGPIGEQNRYAQVLLVVVPFAAFFFRHGVTRMQRIFALLGGGLIFGGIVLTFSRGAFIALVLLMFGMGTARLVKWSHITVLILIASAYVVIQEPDYVARLSSLGHLDSLVKSEGRPTADESSASRLAGNIASWNVFLDHPLLGVGRGIYADYYATHAVNQLGYRQVRDYPSHNLYLNMAAESGILGLGLFMAIIILIAMQLRRLAKLRAPTDTEMSDLATCFLLAIGAYLLSGMFIHLAYERYFWLQLALSSVAIRVIAEEMPFAEPRILTLRRPRGIQPQPATSFRGGRQ